MSTQPKRHQDRLDNDQLKQFQRGMTVIGDAIAEGFQQMRDQGIPRAQTPALFVGMAVMCAYAAELLGSKENDVIDQINFLRADPGLNGLCRASARMLLLAAHITYDVK
jgi:hypothetical protein